MTALSPLFLTATVSLLFVVNWNQLAVEALKCRTDDGPSDGEMKKVARTCMRKLSENANASGGYGGQSNSQQGNRNQQGNNNGGGYSNQQGNSNNYNNNNWNRDGGNSQGNRGHGGYNGNNNNNNNNNWQENDYDDYNDNEDSDDTYNTQRNRDHFQMRTGQNDRDRNNQQRQSDRWYTSMTGNNNNNGRNQNQRNNNSNNNNNGYSNGSGSSYSNRSQDRQSQHQNNNDGACVVHCFFEELNMLNNDNYPDKHKVLHVLTRDIRDRELREFYGDTIQECFQHVSMQRRQNVCQFSKTLVNCMTEYARANCDDWKEHSLIFS